MNEKPIRCPSCNEENPVGVARCARCGLTIDFPTTETTETEDEGRWGVSTEFTGTTLRVKRAPGWEPLPAWRRGALIAVALAVIVLVLAYVGP